MARYIPNCFAAIRYTRNTVLRTSLAQHPLLIIHNIGSSCSGFVCNTTSTPVFTITRVLSSCIHSHADFGKSSVKYLTGLKSVIPRKWEYVPIQSFVGRRCGDFLLIDGHHQQRHFYTSSHNEGRTSSRSPFDSPHSQTSFGTSREPKRKRSGLGQLSSVDFINKKKSLLKETRLKISRRVRRLRTSFLGHNKKIHEKLSDQRAKKDVLVRKLRGKLVTKKEDIKTIPNLLTGLRMASAPVLSYLVINDQFGCALTIFVIAGLSDMLDGYIARNFKNQRTAFGTALDPLADKFLISFLTISLTVNGLIPVPVTALILGRDFGLVTASFYIRYISLSPPRTLARYFDFSHVTAKIYPSNISKINTGFQLSYVACTLAAPVFDFVGSPWLQLLMYTTAATTFLSGADYVFTWRRRLKIIKNT